ncbi:MAG: hypothetical protein WC556_12465 [Candidatus Methanoperedens sp.]
MEQNWFEMRDIRRRKLASAVWIPLRAIDRIEDIGKFGHLGNQSEFFGVGTLAVPTESKDEMHKLSWSDIGIMHNHCGCVEGGKYIPSDVDEGYRAKYTGLHLVLDQRGNSAELPEWHLHQDFVITLGLKREGDSWIRPDEGYIEVARLSKSNKGAPRKLEVRASHLKDYLCARGMGLYVTSYIDRSEVVEDVKHISWPQNPHVEADAGDRWEGRIDEIHEGGMPFGEETAVFHFARTDIDPLDDVPTLLGLPTNDNLKSESWTKKDSGRKLYRVQGELWRNEWIDPASKSPIVRGDEIPPTVFFIVDSEGNQETKMTLDAGGRWLWFRPEVMATLAHRRGGYLSWYTRNTGKVACSPDYGVPFGVNAIGLINVYAKDIAFLPEWQQRIWAGYNVGPEGKVSDELLMSQVNAVPASTQAPEEFLSKGLDALNEASKTNLGFAILRQHDQIPDLIARAHRFRAIDKAGLFSLAKDLARLTADSFDVIAIQKLVIPPKDTKWGSLKSLEKLLTLRIKESSAQKIMGPLVGIYKLRLADAHLPSSETEEALALAGIDQKAPYVTQGYQLLYVCVSSLFTIYEVIAHWEREKIEKNR